MSDIESQGAQEEMGSPLPIKKFMTIIPEQEDAEDIQTLRCEECKMFGEAKNHSHSFSSQNCPNSSNGKKVDLPAGN